MLALTFCAIVLMVANGFRIARVARVTRSTVHVVSMTQADPWFPNSVNSNVATLDKLE